MAGCSMGLNGLTGVGEAAFAGVTTDGGGVGTLAGGGKGASDAPGGGAATTTPHSDARIALSKR
jgi:hypothetical protein